MTGYILEMVNGLLGLADPAEHRPPAPLFGQPGVDPVPETADRATNLGVPHRVLVHDGATGVLQLGDRCGYGFVYTTTLFEHRARPKCYGKTRMASRVDPKTGQPLKGRAMGGSGRLGEMEKDALVMHGGMQLLAERFAAGGTGLAGAASWGKAGACSMPDRHIPGSTWIPPCHMPGCGDAGRL